jgi:PTH1 family peptidyl-tRNA hydrolase
VKLVVGLGNPGPRYAFTRHNVGFRIVEHFGRTRGIPLSDECFHGRFGRGAITTPGGDALDLAILEPLTYMNLSGEAVAEALCALSVDDPARDLLVALDDVDLPFGRLRLRAGGSGGGHRGLGHIIERLGCSGFPRLRFGVGRPPAPLGATEWVLQRFSAEEEGELEARVATAADAVEAALVEGLGPAMNRYNREPPTAE